MKVNERLRIERVLTRAKHEPSESIESETVEFKAYRDEKALHNCKSLPIEISALANLKGGVIVVGVVDSSEILDADWEKQLAGINTIDCSLVVERLRGKVNPKISLAVDQLEFEGKNYVVITVPDCPDCIVATTNGKTCIRDGKSSRAMEPEEIEAKVKSLTTYDWTGDRVRTHSPVALLDGNAVREAALDHQEKRRLDRPIPDGHYLEAVGVTVDGELTKGGLLFLGTPNAIRQHLGDQEFRFTVKQANGELLLNEIWTDNLWNSLKFGRSLFSKFNHSITIELGEETIEVPTLDPIAFHEAYLNALVHRDYSIEGMVSVTCTPKEMVIASPGGFVGGVNETNIGTCDPRHRNKCLARILTAHSLVDRAGVGVFRMNLHSLKYGRSLPDFDERENSVNVTMQAEYLIPQITALTSSHIDDWGVPELVIVNRVWKKGYVPVEQLESELKRVSRDPWKQIVDAVESIDQVELCGTRGGVFVRVVKDWERFFSVEKPMRAYSASEKYVRLYQYLRRHGSASNQDISTHLQISHSSNTSKFLRNARFVRREGVARNATWHLT